MTLDELLDALNELKRLFPASGLATIYGEPCDGVRYDRGDVYVPIRCQLEHAAGELAEDIVEGIESVY